MKSKTVTLWQDRLSYIDRLGRYVTEEVRITSDNEGVYVQSYEEQGKAERRWAWADDLLKIAAFQQAFLDRHKLIEKTSMILTDAVSNIKV